MSLGVDHDYEPTIDGPRGADGRAWPQPEDKREPARVSDRMILMGGVMLSGLIAVLVGLGVWKAYELLGAWSATWPN